MDRQRQSLLQWGVAAGVGLNAAAAAMALGAHAAVPATTLSTPDGNLSPMSKPDNGRPEHDGRHDFDFFHGHWHLHNRRLKTWLIGADDWIEFEGQLQCRPILGGLGNVDELTADFGEGIHGLSLRLFNPADRKWSDYWVSKRNGMLNPPVVGGFVNRVGTFYGDDEYEGRPVRVRAIWRQDNTDAVHWQQAFSADRGQTWETNWTMRMRRIDEHDRLIHDDAVIELRQYTMQPGRRDRLIELFEREFIEPQEAVGMHVLGQFRDLDDPDRYVWLRGFPSMPARRVALQSFYSGPVWQRHRVAANATMRDSDNVLLLKPARLGSGFASASAARAPVGSTVVAADVFSAGICSLQASAEQGFTEMFERALAPLLREAGAELLATYVTDASENTFPRLPVREDEHVFVWFARFDNEAAHRRHRAALADDPRWHAALADARLGDLKQQPQLLRLSPTPRSELR